MKIIDKKRFQFGKNWSKFVKNDFSNERCEASKIKILDFLGVKNLNGFRFLDVGSGSGIHSLAAAKAGADEVYSFDYDPESVSATRSLRDRFKIDVKWTVEEGDALDNNYLSKLGTWNFVYSWGVLHHTGHMWQAIQNVQNLVEKGGYFYIALYSSDADFQPSKEFWLEIKKEYIRSKPITQRFMGWWYVWRFIMNEDIKNLSNFIKRSREYKSQRGMSIMRDVHDWIGGWPMEYAADQDTIDCFARNGFELINKTTGQACSEFLFKRV